MIDFLFDSASLVMFSGGIDSTYLLYQQLTETTDNIHAHHIVFKPHSKFKRDDVESLACERIYKYLMNIRSFTYSSSELDLSQFPYTGWDSDSQLFMASRVAPSLAAKNITVMIGDNANDYKQENVADRLERNVSSNLWTALLNSLEDHQRERINPKIQYPIANLSKQEIIERLPKDLLDLTWSCREPIRNDSGVHPCRKCHACKQIDSMV